MVIPLLQRLSAVKILPTQPNNLQPPVLLPRNTVAPCPFKDMFNLSPYVC